MNSFRSLVISSCRFSTLLCLMAVFAAVPQASSQSGAKGAPMAFTLSSPDFANGADIPRQFTCSGEDRSPALEWKDPPAGTKSFTLIADDPDAPVGTWVHWVILQCARAAWRVRENRSTRGRHTARAERFRQDRLQRTLSAAGKATPLFFQTLCAERRIVAHAGRDEKRCRARDGRPHSGPRGVDGPLPALSADRRLSPPVVLRKTAHMTWEKQQTKLRRASRFFRILDARAALPQNCSKPR